ncbi:GNAT family N-acetyltransferase [Pseudomonas sp. HR96]|uniref:GNAT family N-acetyltransferase n=1 Tax=Pseudomonas sp. HR96 TaxID=1027966 RepID=UPI002A747A02|nr:GNAT family N-acetyltransferase [Pseudomonas sp. HR96]WPP01106.1 GNAT family N-acetyltransferase [Pseudomonas sp. HR96]
MKLSSVRTAQAHDVASVRTVLQARGGALSQVADACSSSEQSLLHRLETTLRDFPFLLAFDDERCVGLAYARPHCAGAYRWSVDVALQVDAQATPGTAERLYRQLLRDLAAQGYLAGYALVAPSDAQSVALHQSLGFVRIGAHQCIDLHQDTDCWCVSLGDSHPLAEPVSFQVLQQSRQGLVAG